MHLNSASLDSQRVLYILTLGVLEGARQQGIGSALLKLILIEVCLCLHDNCLSRVMKQAEIPPLYTSVHHC